MCQIKACNRTQHWITVYALPFLHHKVVELAANISSNNYYATHQNGQTTSFDVLRFQWNRTEKIRLFITIILLRLQSAKSFLASPIFGFFFLFACRFAKLKQKVKLEVCGCSGSFVRLEWGARPQSEWDSQSYYVHILNEVSKTLAVQYKCKYVHRHKWKRTKSISFI